MRKKKYVKLWGGDGSVYHKLIYQGATPFRIAGYQTKCGLDVNVGAADDFYDSRPKGRLCGNCVKAK